MKVEELNDLFAAPEDIADVINEEVEETENNDVDDNSEDVNNDEKTEEVTDEVIDTTSVYNILKDYNLAPEIENPTEVRQIIAFL